MRFSFSLAEGLDGDVMEFLNPLVSNAPFLYPLNTLENLTLFWYFEEVEKGYIGNE